MKQPTIRVLYIDDEEQNLNSFIAGFRRQYEIYTALTAEEGMAILDNVEIHIIMADQKMPKITGVEFFKNIIELYPEPIRILITGYTDIEALADAINHGDIYRYVNKPWNTLELHNTLINAYDAYKTKIDLKNKIIELEKNNNELNRFIYSISHELRAPLVSVLGIVNLVKMENLYHSSGEYWSLVETCSNRLDYYIQKTLQYYKNDKSKLEYTVIDFNNLISNLIELHKFIDNDIEIETNIIQNQSFKGDSFRIEVILGNLISNAIRYQKDNNKSKKVNINIFVENNEAQISIIDNGIGILNEHLDKIFTQFFKERSQHGSGLGLFIVKEALQKINGTIKVSSVINEGTTFKITLPNATN